MPMYDNPASFLPDASQFTSPTMSGFAGGLRMMQEQPFLDQLKQQMQMNTQKQQTELQEFQSPLQTQARQSAQQKIIDEGTDFHNQMQDNANKYTEATRLRPFMTDKQIEEAKVDAQQSKHLFQTAPSTYFAGMQPILEKMEKSGMPREQIKAIYDHLVKTSGYDNEQLPDEVRSYGPNTLGALAAHRYAMVHTPDFEQKQSLEMTKGAAAVAVAQTQGQFRLAEINRQIQGGVYGDINRQQGVLERSLRSGIDPDTGKAMSAETRTATEDSLRRIKSKNVMDYVTKQTQMSQLNYFTSQMNPDPKVKEAGRQQYLRDQEDAYQQGLRLEGLKPNEFTGGGPQGGAGGAHKVGDKITVGNQNVEIMSIQRDGSYRIKGPDGRTGTYRP